MSDLVKLLVLLGTGLLVLVTLVWFAMEQEYGGQDAVRGVVIGRLADGSAEVRGITWPGVDAESTGDYEVLDEGGAAVVRFVDHGGTVLYSGTPDEVAAWLDARGPRLFTGSYQEAVDYRQGLQDEGKSGFPVWLIPIWFVPILTAIITERRKQSRPVTAAG